MTLRATCLALMLLLHQPLLAATQDLRIATWNIANLHHESGVALRNRAVAREDIDYTRLRSIAAKLDADIVALQEVGSPAALARIFPEEEYHLFISGRYRPGDENQPPEKRDIYTAFAVARDRFPMAPDVHTEDAFSLIHFDIDRTTKGLSARPTRSAMVLSFELNGRVVRLLGLHLKSSCHQFSLFPVEDQNFSTAKPYGSRFDCRTLLAQLAVLENWIEAQNALGFPVILAGDFNRHLNRLYYKPTRFEHFWDALQDGQPNGIELIKGPEGQDTVCWPAHKRRYKEHIDFVVFTQDVLKDGHKPVFEKLPLGHDQDPRYGGKNQQRLSDHCPVVATIAADLSNN